MKLKTETGRSIRNPSTDEISIALNSIDGDKCHFASLRVNEMTYVQTSGDPNQGFSLEYQTGSVDRHYIATDEKLKMEEIEKAFLAYSKGDDSWINDHDWIKLDLLTRKRKIYAIITLAVIISGYLIIDKIMG